MEEAQRLPIMRAADVIQNRSALVPMYSFSWEFCPKPLRGDGRITQVVTFPVTRPPQSYRIEIRQLMSTFSLLEQTILKAKGLTAENLESLNAAGVASKADFTTIGTAETLNDILPGLDTGVSQRVMDWAIGHAT